MDNGDDKGNQDRGKWMNARMAKIMQKDNKDNDSAAIHLKHLLQRILIRIHVVFKVYAGRNWTDHVEVILFHDHSSIQDLLALTDQLQTNQ